MENVPTLELPDTGTHVISRKQEVEVEERIKLDQMN